jgi:hypothetical protein
MPIWKGYIPFDSMGSTSWEYKTVKIVKGMISGCQIWGERR